MLYNTCTSRPNLNPPFTFSLDGLSEEVTLTYLKYCPPGAKNSSKKAACFCSSDRLHRAGVALTVLVAGSPLNTLCQRNSLSLSFLSNKDLECFSAVGTYSQCDNLIVAGIPDGILLRIDRGA